MRLPISIGVVLCLGFAAVVSRTLARDGVLEINQACATGPGCFSGDAPGLPVSITNSGSYRLTSNLTQTPTVNVIEILQADVFLDLNGFSLVGATVCTPVVSPPNPPSLNCTPPIIGGGSGIVGIQTGVTIVNGTVRGMEGDGLRLLDGTVRNVNVISNGGIGIDSSGDLSVLDSHISLNREIGIRGDIPDYRHTIIRGNMISTNGNDGIVVGSGDILDNTVSHNLQHGIECFGNCVARNNVVFDNAVDGIRANAGTIIGNLITVNFGYGLRLDGCSPAICSVGYVQNTIISSSGGAIRTVVGGVQIGQNVCNGNTSCP